MRLVLKWILILINLACALALAGSISAQYFDSSTCWPCAFLGLGFPVVLLLNLGFLLFWLIQWKRPVWISLIVLLIALPAMQSSFQLINNKKKLSSSSDPISVMSYNVRLFDIFKWSGKDNVDVELLEFLGSSDTDIICLQEFMVNESAALNIRTIKKKLASTPYSHIEYNYQAYKRKHGLAIFSKYPIIDTGKGNFPGTRNMFIYTDIARTHDTIRVFNAHLESIHLDQKQYSLIDTLNISGTQTHMDEYRQILNSIRQAFVKRAEQARILHDKIKDSPYPAIVSGDFNDTPVSFAYHQIMKGLDDSFVQAGKGMGASYKQFRLPLRIDYILQDQRFA